MDKVRFALTKRAIEYAEHWTKEDWEAFGKAPSDVLRHPDVLLVLCELRQSFVTKRVPVPWGVDSPLEWTLLEVNAAFARGVPAQPVKVFTRLPNGRIVNKRLRFKLPAKLTNETQEQYLVYKTKPIEEWLRIFEEGSDADQLCKALPRRLPPFLRLEEDKQILPDDKARYREWLENEVAYYSHCIRNESKAQLFHRFPHTYKEPPCVPTQYGPLKRPQPKYERLKYVKNKPLYPPKEQKPLTQEEKNAPLSSTFQDLPKINEFPLPGEAVYVPFELGLRAWRQCKPRHWFTKGWCTVPAGDAEHNYNGWRRLLVELRRQKLQTFRNRFKFFRDEAMVTVIGPNLYQLQGDVKEDETTSKPGDGTILFTKAALPPCIAALLAKKQRLKNEERLMLLSYLAHCTDPATKRRVSLPAILKLIKEKNPEYYRANPSEWQAITKSCASTYNTKGGYRLGCRKYYKEGLCPVEKPLLLGSLGYSVTDIEDLGAGGCQCLTQKRGIDDTSPCFTVQAVGARFTKLVLHNS
jgi:hypothetical protein